MSENPLLHQLTMYLLNFSCSLVDERSQDKCISGFTYQCNMLKRADVASLVSTLSGFWISINVLLSTPWGSCPFPKHQIQRISVSQVLTVFHPACCSQTPGLKFMGQGRKPSDMMLDGGSFGGMFGLAIMQQPLCTLPGLGNQSIPLLC